MGTDWDGGRDAYLRWLAERLAANARHLSQLEGALFSHLDLECRALCQGAASTGCLASAGFQNEFIWYYSGGGASENFAPRPKHDNILYYTKSARAWKFYADRVREPYKWTHGQRRAHGWRATTPAVKLPDDAAGNTAG